MNLEAVFSQLSKYFDMMSLSESSDSESLDFEHVLATIKFDHCEETMYPSCKTIHNKARATRDHKEVLREERHTKDQGSTFCTKHPDQKTSLYCNTCNVPVCTKCIARTHCRHDFSDISIILQSFKLEIDESKKKMITRMKEINVLIQNGVQSWEDYENKVKMIESSISYDAVVLYSLLDKMVQKRKDYLNSIRHQDRLNWERAKRRLDVERTKISRSLLQHDKCLSSATTIGMDELLQESEILRNKRLFRIEILSPSYQTPSNISVEGIGEIIKPTKVPPTVPSDKLKVGRPEVISSFNSTLKGSPSICYAGDEQVLIGTTESNDIHTVNSKGKIVHKRENVLKNKCHSLAVFIHGDVLVFPEEGNHVDVLSAQNKLKTLLDTSPYETHYITVTEDERILMCLSKYVGDTLKGHVRLCDKKGGHQRHIGSDNLYEYPIQAVKLKDDEFCISDFGKQRLVVQNAEGNIRLIIQKPLGRETFWPKGISIDKAGNILATDYWNNCVYVIGKDMSVRELVGRTEGITGPRCLCVDDDNYLWIAQYNGKIKVVKYLE